MNKLEKNRYVPVILEKVDSIPFLFDLTAKEHIALNAKFIESLKKNEDYITINDDYFNEVKLFKRNSIENSNIFSDLVALNLKSSTPNSSILNEKEYKKFLTSKIIAASERFIHRESSHHLGSSRHALLYDLQLKGCGRNCLISRLDHHHSWGGMLPIAALYEYISSHITNNSLYLGSMKVFAVNLYNENNYKLENENPVLLMRGADGYRVAQYDIGNMSKFEKDEIKNSLDYISDTKKTDEILNAIVLQNLSLLYFNFYHYSMIAENIMIDGRVMDSESVYNCNSVKSFKIFMDISIDIDKTKDIKFEDVHKLEDYLSFFDETENGKILCNTNIHGVIYSILKSAEILNDVYDSDFNAEDVLNNKFYNFLNQIIEIETKDIGTDLIKLLKHLSKFATYNHQSFEYKKPLKDNFSLSQFLQLFSNLIDLDSFNLFSFSKGASTYYSRISLNINLPERKLHPLVQDYNFSQKMELPKMALFANTYFVENKDKWTSAYAMDLSSDIAQMVNRNSYIFNYKLIGSKIVEKESQISEFSQVISEFQRQWSSIDSLQVHIKFLEFNIVQSKKILVDQLNKWSEVDIIICGLEARYEERPIHILLKPLLIKGKVK